MSKPSPLSNPHLPDIVSKFPEKPGVYIYKNSTNKIIYVGKAINLRKRVSQYFQRDDALGPKTISLVSQIHSIEHRVVASEVQALLLEASLIKQHKPKFNSQLRDDKSYIYICISKEKIPRIFASFKSQTSSKNEFFGPFPSAGTVKALLKTIRRIFPYRSCRVLPNKPCLYHDLGLCTAPCVNPENYTILVGKIRRFLNGNLNSLIHDSQKRLNDAIRTENYEQAIVCKKELDNLTYITSSWQSVQNLTETTELPEDEISRALSQIKTTLIPYYPQIKNISRIECYDISNLGNNYFTGAMAVFSKSKIDRSQFRHFKIKSIPNQDDMHMLKEVIYRRLKHPEWPKADLIILDGGIPQLSVVSPLLSGQVTMGLAKKKETIVIKVGDNWQEINLPKSSSAIKLITNLRDETHRFANRYRKILIKKTNFTKPSQKS